MMANDRCKYCDAEIIWARNTKGNWLPLDAVRVEHGNRFVIAQDQVAYSTVVGPGHTSHVITCEKAEDRKKKRDDGQGELFS